MTKTAMIAFTEDVHAYVRELGDNSVEDNVLAGIAYVAYDAEGQQDGFYYAYGEPEGPWEAVESNYALTFTTLEDFVRAAKEWIASA